MAFSPLLSPPTYYSPPGPGVMETRGRTRELLSSCVTLPVYRDTTLLNHLERGEGEEKERGGGGGGSRGGERERGGGGGGRRR